MYGEGRGFRNGVESAGFGVSAFGVRACLGQVAIWVHGLRVRGFNQRQSPICPADERETGAVQHGLVRKAPYRAKH